MSKKLTWLLIAFQWRKEELQGAKQKQIEMKNHKAATRRLTLSQKTLRHEQKDYPKQLGSLLE